MNLQTFKVRIPQETLDDIQERLARTRWTDEISDAGWDYGSNLSYMKELIDYWQSYFDWREQEKKINFFNHFRANIDNFGIHFIHERGKGSNPMPIIITHGWPSSFYQMLKIIPLLTDPESHGGDPTDSFDVIVPSMPGYGFSDLPAKRGFTVTHIADLWARLMKEELGYYRFAAQGGDIGSGVTARLALNNPELLAGIHITDVRNPYLGDGAPELSEAERKFQAEEEKWEEEEGAYGSIQATKPQTLAYGLNDSPAGLAAWVVEKFRSWSDCDGDVERRFTKDELLTNITIYWATETINSSIRLYYEHQHNSSPSKHGERIQVPTAVALFPKDLSHPPREWAERTCDIQRWTEMPRGGHFAAMEEPELLVEDIRAFFRTLR
jgi:microsomal epoxide hydrolase